MPAALLLILLAANIFACTVPLFQESGWIAAPFNVMASHLLIDRLSKR